jgi:hypothetical protein
MPIKFHISLIVALLFTSAVLSNIDQPPVGLFICSSQFCEILFFNVFFEIVLTDCGPVQGKYEQATSKRSFYFFVLF